MDGTSMTIEELERAVEFHDYQYWVLNKPVISDEEYDLLTRRLEELKPDSPALHRVGAGGFATESFRNKVTHAQPMLSLDKCYEDEKFFLWLKTIVGSQIKKSLEPGGPLDGDVAYAAFGRAERVDDLLAPALELPALVSPKLDGVAASLRYGEDGELFVATTRGDGTVGEDFTLNAKLIPDIPWRVKKGGIEVRGEIYMKRTVFRDKYAKRFPNSRNLTAGSLKQKESARGQLLDLSFYPYDIVGTVAKSEREKQAQLLELGFPPGENLIVKMADVPAAYIQAVAARDSWDFEADGIVIKLDDVGLHSLLGETAHHPRFALAYKFQGDVGFTTLEDVEWSVARSGTITPVANVAPVFLSGASVSRSTLHNIKEFTKLALKRGDRVQMKRRGDVIPKVEANLGGGDEPFPVPAVCPSCGLDTILTSPQLFVSGFRFSSNGDAEQLLALVDYLAPIAAKVGILSFRDTCNSVARREGDVHYRNALTWKRNSPEERGRVTKLASSLPTLKHPFPRLSALLVLDPDLAAAREALALIAPLVMSQRLELALLPVAESRYEQSGHESPAFDSLLQAGKEGRFWAELASLVPEAAPLLESKCVQANGDFSDSWLEGWTLLAYRLSDDVLSCSRPLECRDAAIGTLEHFIRTIGVDGFGRKIIENLYDAGLLTARHGFFGLQASDLTELERMGEILATKLVDNVAGRRTLPLSTFLQSLGVEELARNVSTIIERECVSIEAVWALTEAQVMEHESVAFGIAHQVIHGLRRARPAIDELLKHVTLAKPVVEDRTGLPLVGQSFVFTGKMRTMPRKEAQAKVAELGAETPSGVTTDLTWLVVGDEGSALFGEGSKGSKLKKAEKYVAQGAKLNVISETKFLEMLDNDEP